MLRGGVLLVLLRWRVVVVDKRKISEDIVCVLAVLNNSQFIDLTRYIYVPLSGLPLVQAVESNITILPVFQPL